MGRHLLGHGRVLRHGLSEEGRAASSHATPSPQRIFLVTKLIPQEGNLTERLDKA